jgi:hypothetical protein
MGIHAYIISDFLSWGRKFFRLKEGLLDVWLRRSLRGSLIKLKLLAEKKLEESLVRLKLLAEEKLDPSLVRLELLLEKRMAGSLVRLDLSHAEEKNAPQFGSPKFPLQLISRG